MLLSLFPLSDDLSGYGVFFPFSFSTKLIRRRFGLCPAVPNPYPTNSKDHSYDTTLEIIFQSYPSAADFESIDNVLAFAHDALQNLKFSQEWTGETVDASQKSPVFKTHKMVAKKFYGSNKGSLDLIMQPLDNETQGIADDLLNRMVVVSCSLVWLHQVLNYYYVGGESTDNWHRGLWCRKGTLGRDMLCSL